MTPVLDRKFWTMLIDVVFSSAVFLVTRHVDPELGKDILWLIAAWQPIVIALVVGTAVENAAGIRAGQISKK